ncbi:hypothetical protein [Rhizobium etli]|uniref:hypothetical protein n=1 Tax=Rhizobium etli TaxID=29449 RepID=UPI0005A92065|nr:hypothetical protein [Rhizobium etli]
MFAIETIDLSIASLSKARCPAQAAEGKTQPSLTGKARLVVRSANMIRAFYAPGSRCIDQD